MTPNTLFKTYVDTPGLTRDEERELIQAAQDGCQDAYATLLLQYGPLLKRYAAQAPSHVEKDEVQGTLMLGFVEAITAFNGEDHSTLAATLPHFLKRALSDIGVSASSFTIPSRSLSRWLSILRKADGNIYQAINMAPEYGMTRDTFLSINTALRQTNSLEAVMTAGEYITRSIHIQTDEPVGETDSMLAEMVFETKGDENDLSEREASVLRYAYGYLTYGEALTDDAVGAHLGMSRPSVQRIRRAALDKAARRLGVA